MASNDVNAVLQAARNLAASGTLSEAEAEGAAMSALNLLAPAEAAASEERVKAQLAPDHRALLDDAAQEDRAALEDRLARARQGLLDIPDEEWEAALELAIERTGGEDDT